jgi:PhnB protein
MGDMTHYRPDGYTSLTPFLCIDGAAAAIDFYTSVFGAGVVTRHDLPDGKVAHAELQFESGRLQLSDPDQDHHLVAPSGADDVTHSTVIYVRDVDDVHARALAAGAKSHQQPETFVTGDRFCSLHDPWGHRWAVLTRVEDVTPEEAQRRVDAWLAEEGAGQTA